LIEEEAALQPEWAVTLQGISDSDEKLRCKDEELALATDIVVPSTFVRNTLRKAGCLQARISLIPYGTPALGPGRKPRTPTDGKLKVLFVGALSQRKGLSYLLQAVTRLASQIDLTIVGRRVAECPVLDAALRVHHWIPSLSHDEVLEEMSRNDVMVFPSLFEGCGLVVLEAASRGVPVITTPNTVGSDFVSDGDDGFIVPIRDAAAIVEKLEILLLNRDRLDAMSRAAIHKAAQHSWEQYRHRLAITVRQALSKDITTSQSSYLEAPPSC
jgi:glycosyltransferase involved in cell wall biosynthesis